MPDNDTPPSVRWSARLQLILDTMEDLVFVLDDQGHFVEYYQSAREDLYTPPEQFLGKHHSDVLPPDVSQCIQEGLDTLERGEETADVDYALTIEGSSRWYNTRICRIDREDVGPTGYLAVSRNITQRKRAEQEKERLLEELQETLARLHVLQGLLSICAGCKKIRDKAGQWHHLEAYIAQHSNAEFSHGMCSDCAHVYYPEINTSPSNPRKP